MQTALALVDRELDEAQLLVRSPCCWCWCYCGWANARLNSDSAAQIGQMEMEAKSGIGANKGVLQGRTKQCVIVFAGSPVPSVWSIAVQIQNGAGHFKKRRFEAAPNCQLVCVTRWKFACSSQQCTPLFPPMLPYVAEITQSPFHRIRWTSAHAWPIRQVG